MVLLTCLPSQISTDLLPLAMHHSVLSLQIHWNVLLLRILSRILNLPLPQLLQWNANGNKLTFLLTLFLDMLDHHAMLTLKTLKRQLRTLLPFSQTVGCAGSMDSHYHQLNLLSQTLLRFLQYKHGKFLNRTEK